MKGAAICDGAHFHLLDHLAPLCYYLNLPLITDHPLSYQLAKTYYPQIKTLLIEEDYLSFLADQYDVLITTSRFTSEELGHLLYEIKGKKMKFLFTPHGNSDKGIEIFKHQTHVLIYGEQMRERLSSLPLTLISMGNLRYQFYQEQRPFYDTLFHTTKKTVLYAPTWNDEEKLTSFFKMYTHLIETLPPSLHLIIKLHPLLEKYYPSECYYLLGQGEIHKNLTVLHEFPPIYPLLAKTDYYLGDYSSIGYDFLSFNRPLFFIDKPDSQAFLHQYGTCLNQPIFNAIEHYQDTLTPFRTNAYSFVFDPPKNSVLLKEECKAALQL